MAAESRFQAAAGAGGSRGGPAAEDGVADGVFADDIQVGVVLAGERSVRAILVNRRRAHGNGRLIEPGEIGQPAIRRDHLLAKRLR